MLRLRVDGGNITTTERMSAVDFFSDLDCRALWIKHGFPDRFFGEPIVKRIVNEQGDDADGLVPGQTYQLLIEWELSDEIAKQLVRP